MPIANVTTTFRQPYTFERLSDELLCAMLDGIYIQRFNRPHGAMGGCLEGATRPCESMADEYLAVVLSDTFI